MTRAAIASLLLVAVGLLGGARHYLAGFPVQPTVGADDPACPDCIALAVDLHAHTRFSDGVLSPMELVLAAKRARLDAIAVTEHNVLFPAQIAAAFSRLVDGPIVLTGQEVTTSKYHLIAVGLSERVSPSHDLRAVIAEVHRQGAVAIAAHPTKRYWSAFDPVRGDLDAAEVLHPAAFSDSRVFRWEDMVAFYEREGAEPLTAVGSSDFHFFQTLGLCRTEVIAKERSSAAILAALKEGATRVRAPDGRTFGRPGGSSRPVPLPRPYAALDGFDWATRALGWVGVVGLLLFRRRRV